MKILCFTPNCNDGTAFYRSNGVLSELHKLDSNIHITFVEKQFRFQDAKGYDIAFFQRPDDEQYLFTMKAIRKLGIPIVVDYDDYLLNVPVENRYHQVQKLQDNPYEKIVTQCLALADRVIVSTDYLAQSLGYPEKTIVIKNAIDDYCFRLIEKNNFNKRVLWRGGLNHKGDIEKYSSDILSIIKENPDFEFLFWTDIPKRDDNLVYSSIVNELRECPNFSLMQALDPISYFQTLPKLKPSLILTINDEIPFNKGKSDIAKLEGFYCGALAIHPDWPEWDWEIMKIDSKYLCERANFMIGLVRNNDTRLSEIYDGELNYIKENRLLSKVNQQRLDVFNDIKADMIKKSEVGSTGG